MMFFEWKPEMKVDGGPVDADHKALFAIANRMFAFTYPNRESDEIKQVIQDLYEYVRVHFAREEALMQELDYPERFVHAEIHAAIIDDMNHHLTSAHHMVEILGNFKGLVNRWIVNHILEEDLKIGQFIRDSISQQEKEIK